MDDNFNELKLAAAGGGVLGYWHHDKGNEKQRPVLSYWRQQSPSPTYYKTIITWCSDGM